MTDGQLFDGMGPVRPTRRRGSVRLPAAMAHERKLAATRRWKAKVGHAWHRHRLTGENRAALLRTQGGTCAICRGPNATNVDHDHAHCPGYASCGRCARGILCRYCNATLLSIVESAPTLVEPVGRLAWYLRRGYAVFHDDGSVTWTGET